ncbi:MAG: MoxR family ATPase [Desulfomonilia bacterium]|jgi:MoxR-like ATPase
MLSSPEEIRTSFAQHNFIVDSTVSTVVYLAIRLGRPLLVEGPAGVGKTELARVLALVSGRELIRLQCYEGLDESKSLYEWNYQKQLLRIYTDQNRQAAWDEIRQTIYTEEFLLERPLLKALNAGNETVLLIDEVDKSDEEFESFLLEILSDYQISIPEMGTVTAKHIPIVVLTSNNFREFGDALKRRCIHLYLDYPTFEQELAIVRLKVPGISEGLAGKVVEFVQAVRQIKLKKAPSIAETLNWAQALLELEITELDSEVFNSTAGVLLKYKSDIEQVSEHGPSLS